jgi:aerobic-type carbon monoxide dehydrogenase small subunit (CoxS/CutS family)
MDGKRVYACSVLAIDAQDAEIETVEALASNDKLDALQQAFVNADASQCGYCTSGFVMSAKAFLSENPQATLEEIKKGMCGNLCRCGTYAGISEALLSVVQNSRPKANLRRRRG